MADFQGLSLIEEITNINFIVAETDAPAYASDLPDNRIGPMGVWPLTGQAGTAITGNYRSVVFKGSLYVAVTGGHYKITNGVSTYSTQAVLSPTEYLGVLRNHNNEDSLLYCGNKVTSNGVNWYYDSSCYLSSHAQSQAFVANDKIMVYWYGGNWNIRQYWNGSSMVYINNYPTDSNKMCVHPQLGHVVIPGTPNSKKWTWNGSNYTGPVNTTAQSKTILHPYPISYTADSATWLSGDTVPVELTFNFTTNAWTETVSAYSSWASKRIREYYIMPSSYKRRFVWDSSNWTLNNGIYPFYYLGENDLSSGASALNAAIIKCVDINNKTSIPITMTATPSGLMNVNNQRLCYLIEAVDESAGNFNIYYMGMYSQTSYGLSGQRIRYNTITQVHTSLNSGTLGSASATYLQNRCWYNHDTEKVYTTFGSSTANASSIYVSASKGAGAWTLIQSGLDKPSEAFGGYYYQKIGDYLAWIQGTKIHCINLLNDTYSTYTDTAQWYAELSDVGIGIAMSGDIYGRMTSTNMLKLNIQDATQAGTGGGGEYKVTEAISDLTNTYPVFANNANFTASYYNYRILRYFDDNTAIIAGFDKDTFALKYYRISLPSFSSDGYSSWQLVTQNSKISMIV